MTHPSPTHPASSALLAARSLCATQLLPQACLLMVATPIGNLADISLRALAMLERCDLVAAEDTRMAQRLLQAYDLSKPLLRADRHREQQAAAALLEALGRGQKVAFVSDAGTPAINDPGALLTRAARDAGYPVIPLPGDSSVSTALSAAGIELALGYSFVGYAPASAKQRQEFWREQLLSPRTVVCFEAPHRIADSLAELAALAPQRPLLLAKELTKQFETLRRGTPQQLLDWLAADPRHAQGEFLLALEPSVVAADVDAQAQSWLLRLARELPASRAAALVAEMLGADRKTLYRWLLQQQGGQAAAE